MNHLYMVLRPGSRSATLLLAVACLADPAPLNAQSFAPPGWTSDPDGGGRIGKSGQDDPPVLIDGPQSQTVAPGSTVNFEVAVTGTPPFHYQWRLNGVLLADQTRSTLVLDGVQPMHGGSYRVTVWNEGGVIVSDPATLVVRAATELPPTDQFSDRPQFRTVAGVLQGNSAEASREPGEPIVPDGGKSVWFEWTAPADGIVRLTSQGSAFDTLLNVFTGRELGRLTWLTGDDDQGGFYTSRLQFNAETGTAYQIALDGFGPAGAGGEFTISWDFEVTADRVPLLVAVPQSQVLLPGGDAEFAVLTDSPSDSYQWFHNEQPIRGATSRVLTVVNAQWIDLGIYHVEIRNDAGRLVQSPSAHLEFGSELSSFTQLQYQKSQASGNRPPAGFVSIALGGTVWKQASAPPPEPGSQGICDAFWGSIAQGLHAEDNGVILVHTTGSDIEARIAVYEDYHSIGDEPIACGPPGNPSMVLFDAVQGVNYTIEIEGVDSGGNITLTNLLGIAPPILADPDHCLLHPGGNITLHMPATDWVPVPDCQWLLDDKEITGATNTSLLITEFDLSQTGAYSVVMSNFVRTATHTVAHLDMAGPFTLESLLSANNGNADFVITASDAPPFLLVTSTNLDPTSPWIPLVTNQEPCLIFHFTHSNLSADPQRFFRAIPWPVPEQ